MKHTLALFLFSVAFSSCYMNPGGFLFGCTILNKNVPRGRAARFMMKVTNNSKAFCNLEDDLNDLKEELSKRFKTVKINVVGCMALFSAR